MRKNRYVNSLRLCSQFFFVLVSTIISVTQYLAQVKLIKLPFLISLYPMTPLGTAADIFQLIKNRSMQALSQPWGIMALAVIITFVLSGSVFCGWICPFGSLQEWLGKLSKKIFPWYNKGSKKIDKYLRYLRYIVLLFVAFQTFRTSAAFFNRYDPANAIFNIWSDSISMTGYGLMALFFLLSFFIERPFCRYLCPLGALGGIFNLFSLMRIKRTPSSCIDCKVCDNSCAMNIRVSNESYVKDTLCNRCMKCVSNCPVNDDAVLVPQFLFSEAINHKEIKKRFFIGLPVVFIIVCMIISVFIPALSHKKEKTYKNVSEITANTYLYDLFKDYQINEDALYRAFGIAYDISKNTMIKDIPLGEGVNHAFLTEKEVKNIITYLNKDIAQFVSAVGRNLETLSRFTGITDFSGMTLFEVIRRSESGAIARFIYNRDIALSQKDNQAENIPSQDTQEQPEFPQNNQDLQQSTVPPEDEKPLPQDGENFYEPEQIPEPAYESPTQSSTQTQQDLSHDADSSQSSNTTIPTDSTYPNTPPEQSMDTAGATALNNVEKNFFPQYTFTEIPTH